jgi:hypothetical protein
VLVDGAFLKELQNQLRTLSEANRTGKLFLERLKAIPFGWPEGAVKAGLAALLRARRLIVRLPNAPAITIEDERAQQWLTSVQQFNRSLLESTLVQLGPVEVAALAEIFREALGRPALDTIEKLEHAVKDALATAQSEVGEAIAALEGIRHSGMEALRECESILRNAADAELPSRKLQLLIDGSRALGPGAAKTLGVCTSLARTVRALRVAGKLKRLAEVRTRVTSLYPNAPLDGEDLAFLQEAVGSDALLFDADRVLDRDERCFAAYASAYRRLHVDTDNAATRARAQFAAHSAWSSLTEERRRALEQRVPVCGAAGDLVRSTSPDGTCPTCKLDFEALSTQQELVAHRATLVLRELEALSGGASNVAPPPLKSEPSRRSKTPQGATLGEYDLPNETAVESAIRAIELELRKLELPARVRFVVEPDGD